ncbi:uncharacterized protein [Euwallacea similis]|uniref:uncharacterized protein n=1 Tax=Euwallacea similis TaxID=1736056 RepID=UPI0034504379
MEFLLVATTRYEIQAVIRFLTQKTCHKCPQVVTQSASEVMATVWDEKGVDFIDHGTTINADRYCETLKKIKRPIQNRRKRKLSKGVCLLHDNACHHVVCTTIVLLQEFGQGIVTHSPYRPEPSDYRLFPKLKEHLGGKHSSNGKEMKEIVRNFLKSKAASWYDMDVEKYHRGYKNALTEMVIIPEKPYEIFRSHFSFTTSACPYSNRRSIIDSRMLTRWHTPFLRQLASTIGLESDLEFTLFRHCLFFSILF